MRKSQNLKKSQQPRFYRFSKRPTTSLHSKTNSAHFSSVQPSLNSSMFGTQTLSKRIPKQFFKDKQLLYSQNMTLRNNLKELQAEKVKLQTRLKIQQRQNKRILNKKALTQKHLLNYQQFQETKHPQEMFKTANEDKNLVLALSSKCKELINSKKILRQANEQISELKNQVKKLRRTLKYTSLQQLKIEKAMLVQQLNRVKFIHQQYLSIQNNLQKSNAQKQQRKIKQLTTYSLAIFRQLRQKTTQVAQLSQKMEKLSQNKIDQLQLFQKKVKTLQSIIQKERTQKYRLIFNHKSKDSKQKQCILCLQKKAKISQLQQANQQLSQKITLINSDVNIQKQTIKQLQSQIQQNKKLIVQLQNKDQKPPESIQSEINLSLQQITEYLEQKKQILDFSGSAISNQMFQSNYSCQKIVDKLEGSIDMEQKSSLELKSNINCYTFGQLSPFIQKQKKSIKSDSSNILYKKRVLRETLTYRFMAQRYTISQLQADMKNSEISEWNQNQLSEILRAQPFFLNRQQTKLFIETCNQLKGNQKITRNNHIENQIFIQAAKIFIKNIDLPTQLQEQQILQKIRNQVRKNHESLIKYLDKSINQQQNKAKFKSIPKKQFIEALKQYCDFSQIQLAFCLSQASIFSRDIEHINYSEFFLRFG